MTDGLYDPIQAIRNRFRFNIIPEMYNVPVVQGQRGADLIAPGYGPAAAYYDPTVQSIYISGGIQPPSPSYEETLAHEMGHAWDFDLRGYPFGWPRSVDPIWYLRAIANPEVRDIARSYGGRTGWRPMELVTQPIDYYGTGVSWKTPQVLREKMPFIDFFPPGAQAPLEPLLKQQPSAPSWRPEVMAQPAASAPYTAPSYQPLPMSVKPYTAPAQSIPTYSAPLPPIVKPYTAPTYPAPVVQPATTAFSPEFAALMRRATTPVGVRNVPYAGFQEGWR